MFTLLMLFSRKVISKEPVPNPTTDIVLLQDSSKGIVLLQDNTQLLSIL